MATKKRPGRPSTFTQATADVICERIAAGESLRAICAEDGMPNASTVIRWLAAGDDDIAAGVESEFTGFCKQYARAREDQADMLAEEMLDVARAKSADQVEATDKRLLIDALKWRAGKLRPKVYGDSQRIDQHVTGDVQHTVRVVLSDE